MNMDLKMGIALAKNQLGLVTRLKDLIKSIRACKTAADERAVITRESAYIRTSFREESNDLRHINVAKLLYIHMLGYSAHFGQIECLKLVASPKFSDKRLGYLGIMLLLDENQEVLTLVTNCLKNDMNNSNMYVVGLALCTLGNISSPEMARDLCSEVEKLLGSSNTYIRKKAALCALRVIKKVPDLIENFQARAKGLLNERNHGVLLTGITLLIEMCRLDPQITNDIRQHAVPVLVRHLKNLVTAGFSPEHDVSGITDPFLQVKILRLLKILGKGNVEASEAMNDVLAQVATNTEASKNVGNAILYETVLTIMETESDSSLRVLGINILGRFLQNRDNNIRYVALTTLTKTAQSTIQADSSALQRHRSTVLDCLRDPDISIRRRALDLSFFLINPQNIRILTRELLSFLEVAEGDIRSSVASRICDFAGRYRPNKRWEVDTVTRVLRVAGAYVDQATVNHFVKLVTTSPTDLQQYTVRKLYNLVKIEGDRALAQEGLVQAMAWCVGEYGDVLVSQAASSLKATEEDEVANESSGEYQVPPTEAEVVILFDSILRGPFATSYVKEYIITALAKLSSRFKGESTLSQITQVIGRYRTHTLVEIQSRAVEFGAISQLDRDTRFALLERMPVLESAVAEENLKGSGQPMPAAEGSKKSAGGAAANILGLGDDLAGLSIAEGSKKPDDIYNLVFGDANPTSATSPSKAAAPKSDNIMDLLGGLGMSSSAPAPAAKPTAAADLLGDLFGGGSAPAAAAPKAAVDPLGDLLGGAASKPAASTGGSLLDSFGAAPAAAASHQCYNKNGLIITLSPTRESNGTVTAVTASFKSTGPSITNIAFQVAVPKTLKLQMFPASGAAVSGAATVTQSLRIENPSKVAIKLRLKISYQSNGQGVEEVVDFAGFDSSFINNGIARSMLPTQTPSLNVDKQGIHHHHQHYPIRRKK
ncbi:clathrin associated protein complex large subunit [Phlyctochytrium bullatum]|nr:clathrin associated protein complex large subunit [Phlyctochytrium bullatum]